jgi:hypothetical protein
MFPTLAFGQLDFNISTFDALNVNSPDSGHHSEHSSPCHSLNPTNHQQYEKLCRWPRIANPNEHDLTGTYRTRTPASHPQKISTRYLRNLGRTLAWWTDRQRRKLGMGKQKFLVPWVTRTFFLPRLTLTHWYL